MTAVFTAGLCNGASGTAVDMIIDCDNIAPNLASGVIIDLKTTYTLVLEPEKQGWVPTFLVEQLFTSLIL